MTTTPPNPQEVKSIGDDAKFIDLLEAHEVESWDAKSCGYDFGSGKRLADSFNAIVTYIDTLLAYRVAEARVEGMEEGMEMIAQWCDDDKDVPAYLAKAIRAAIATKGEKK